MRAQWIAEHGPCQQCGSTENLEIDHIDPKTKNPVLQYKIGQTSAKQKIWNLDKKRRELELAKCQVLCKPCHIIKTREERHKEACPKGHLMTPDNIRTCPSKPNVRICETCRKERRRIAEARKKAVRKIHTAPRFVEFS